MSLRHRTLVPQWRAAQTTRPKVPNPCRPIGRCCDYPFAVRAEADAMDQCFMPVGEFQRASGANVPNPRRPFVGGDEDRLPVWAEFGALERAIELDRRGQELACPRIPK